MAYDVNAKETERQSQLAAPAMPHADDSSWENCGQRSESVQCAQEDLSHISVNGSAQDRERRADDRYSIEPNQRAVLLQSIEVQMRNDNPDLARILQLSPEQENALFLTLAEQTVELVELSKKRAVRGDTYAERRALQAEIDSRVFVQQQVLNEILGHSKYELYLDHQRKAPEHQQVAALRRELAESEKLSDEQVGRLVSAMYEERQQFVASISDDANASGYVLAYPFVGFTQSADPDVRRKFAQEQEAKIEAFLGRIHKRADSILTKEQLKRFDEMQQTQWRQERSALDRMRRPAKPKT